MSDVTQRVRAESALRETLEMQRAILQSATYAIIATDARGIIQSFNPAAETLCLASSRSQALSGRAQPTIFHDRRRTRRRARPQAGDAGRAARAGLRGRRWRARTGAAAATSAEWTCLRADGTPFPMRISHAVLRDENGEVRSAVIVSIGYDLSETRRAQKLKDEFVSVVSHELRTPLTSIRGALGLLSGGVAGTLPPKRVHR